MPYLELPIQFQADRTRFVIKVVHTPRAVGIVLKISTVGEVGTDEVEFGMRAEFILHEAVNQAISALFDVIEAFSFALCGYAAPYGQLGTGDAVGSPEPEYLYGVWLLKLKASSARLVLAICRAFTSSSFLNLLLLYV